MGVLDDIKTQLSGTQETVINTEIPVGTKGSLERIAEQLRKRDDLEAFSAGPEKIMMPDTLRPAPTVGPVQPSAKGYVMPGGNAPENQTLGMRAPGDLRTAAEIAAQNTPQQPTIGPATKDPAAMSIIEGIIGQDKTIGPDEAYDALMPIIRSAGAGAVGSIASMMETVASISNQAYAQGRPGEVGAPEAGAIDQVKAQAGGLRAGGVKGFGGELIEAAASLGVDLPVIISYGEFGLAALGAYRGLGVGGAKGAVSGAVQGFILGKVMGAVSKSAHPVLGNSALFAGLAQVDGGDRREVLKQAILGGVMGMSGAKEGRRSKAEKFLRENFPEFTPDDFLKYGGEEKILNDAIDGVAAVESSKIQGPIEPLYTDPKWYYHLKEKGLVPDGVKPPAGSENYRTDRWRNPGRPAAAAEASGATMVVDKPYTDIATGESKNRLVPATDVNDQRLNLLNQGNTPGFEDKWNITQINPKTGKVETTMRARTQKPEPTLATKRPYANKDGRWFVPAPMGHPGADQGGMIALSRLVFEEKRGGYLGPEEVVHHGPDFYPGNNAPENLHAIPSQGAHKGYHASEAGRSDKARQGDIAAASGMLAERVTYIENTKTGEFAPALPGYQVGPYDIVIQQYKSGGRSVLDYGESVPKDLLEKAGGPVAGGEAPVSVVHPMAEAGGIMGRPPEGVDRIVDEVGKLVNEPPGGPHQYGWSFHPEDGDSQAGWTKGKYILSKWPDRGEIYPGGKPTVEQIRQFVVKNADVLKDRRNFIGGWSADNGDFHMDISTTESDMARATAGGKQYDQKAIGYDHPTEGYQDVPTGGTGHRWTPEETAKAGWPNPVDRNEKLPAEPGAAPSGDPAVALLEGIQKIGLTTQAPEEAKSFRQRAEGWVTAVLDRFYPIHKYSKMAGKLLPGQDPSLMIKSGALAGTTGKAEAMIFRGGFKTDIYGMNHPTGDPALNEIYKPFRDDMPGFDKFLVSRAAIEEEGLNKFRKPADWVNTGVDLDEARAYVAANAAKYEAGAKQYTNYFQSLLRDLEDSGLQEPGKRYEWKGQRPDYAPLRRDMEALTDSLEASGNHGARQTLERIASPIRQRLGSDKPIIPPSQSAIIMTYEITAAVERQKVARAIVDLRDKFGMEDLITEIHPGPAGEIPSGRGIVMVKDAGMNRYYKVPEDLADSMKLIHETGLGPLVKAMSIPSRWLRTGATSAPGFAVRNPIRDWQTAFINSKAGFNPITDFTRGLWSLITKDRSYWDWKQSGAEWSMLVTLDKSMAEEAIREMKAATETGPSAWKAKWLKSPLAYLEMLSEAGEKPTRIGVFTRSKRAGLSDMEAAAESRGASTDFAVRGSGTKELSALYTFLNARAQTTYKLAQTAREHPGQFIVRGVASAALPTILLYALNRDDPEYWKRSKSERAMFWFLPIKIGGRQAKIPKGELGILFGNPVEMALESIDAQPDGRLKVTDYLNNVFQTMSPIGNVGELAPTFARPGIEWITNTKFYSGTSIENETDKQVAPYLRYGPHTSETAKAVGQALGAFNNDRGVGPKKLENALYGYTGGVGRMTLGLADWLAGKAGILPDNAKPKEPLSGTPLRPIVQGFLSQRASGFEGEPARAFYAAAESVGETEKTLENLVKQGPGKREGEIKSWIEGHPQEMELLRISKSGKKELFTNGRTELSNLRKAENKIASDSTLSAEEKRKALDFIDKRVSAIVDPVWKLINAVSSQKKTSPGQSGK